MEERCEKSDLPRSMCAHCLGHKEETVGPDEDRVILAVFSGECRCGFPIRRGKDKITKSGGRWVHERCAE